MSFGIGVGDMKRGGFRGGFPYFLALFPWHNLINGERGEVKRDASVDAFPFHE